MATLALPRPRLTVTARALDLAPLVLGVVGLLLGWAGAAWDVAWHRMLGRETFWAPPHLGMYAGTALVGIAALVATATAMRGRTTATAELRVGPLRVERSLAIVGIGAAVIIGAAPFDELWHRTFGRDVDIWSPPHLVGIAGALLVYAGWSAATAAHVFALRPRVREALTVFFLAGLVGSLVFGMNLYYIFGWSREALVYPLVVCATIPLALGMSTELLPHRLAATVVALAYTLFAVTTITTLRVLGWPPHAFAPLVVVGALAVDLVHRRTASAFLVGVAFAAAFVVAEGLRLLAFAPPPPSPGLLRDAQLGNLATQYWAMANARPWLSAWPLLAIAIGTPLAAVAWTAGRRAARFLSAR